MDDPKVEALASLAHEQWAGWMRHVFKKCARNDDGTMTIPKWAVDAWVRQVVTPYALLDEREQEMDRVEARRMIAVYEGKPDPGP